MPQQALIRQIFYDERTRAQLDPGFVPLDNTANPRPDWSEYWPIRQFFVAHTFVRDAGYGFLSPKFGAKTGLTAADVHRFIAEEEADVFLYSPWLDQSATVLKVFLIERVASFILATESRWKVRAYDPARLPLSKTPIAGRDTLMQLDALKRAWRTDAKPEHLRAYRGLRALLAGPLRPSAGVFHAPR